MRCAASVFAIGTLLVASCTSVEVETPLQRGVLPEKIGRVGWRCPDDHPIVALHGVAFPPGHPDTPVLVPSPDRCFRSIAEADRAGYPAADPPAGGRLHRRHLPCPNRRRSPGRLHPAGSLDSPGSGVPAPAAFRCLADPVGISPQRAVRGWVPFPPGHDPEAVSHLWVISTRPELEATLEGCSLVLGRTPTTIHGKPATFIRCGEASEFHGGHVLVVWREGRASHAVSLHGVTEQNRRLVRAIAESVELISPT